MIIEARGRTGGRIVGIEGHDMGPSWVWPHQKSILEVIESLNVGLFAQYTQGAALYDAPNGVERFTPPPASPSYRISGGVTQLIKALEDQLLANVHLNEKVLSLIDFGDKIEVKTDLASYEADRVVSTLPPRLAMETIAYSPPLDATEHTQLQKIPTWMGYSTKCVIEYPEAFWREEGLSGFAISHIGPLGEIHDASTADKAALFGFLHSHARYDHLEEDVVKQLVRLYGRNASKPLKFYYVDWKKEQYTSTSMDAMPLREHPSYGFDIRHFNGKLLFSGTESAYAQGGYLDGAIHAAKQIAGIF